MQIQADGSPFIKESAKYIGVFAAYFVTAKFGLKLDAVSHFATFIWPPTGIALASVVLFGPRVWPALLAAALLVNFNTGAPILVALGIGAGNTLEALAGAYLLKRFVNFNSAFSRLRDGIGFLFFACAVSTMVSATIGVFSLWLGGVNPLEGIFVTWRAWWMGDALGSLVIAPLILVLATVKFSKPRFWQLVQGLAITSAVTFVSLIVLGPGNYPAFWFFPLIIWAGVAFGQRGNVVMIFTISSVTILAAINNWGPFERGSLRDNLIFLDNFLVVIATTGMLLASVVEERRRAILSLEKAVKAREDFLSIASHELKTPLTALNLQFQVAQQLSDAQTVDTFSGVERQVTRLNRLVDEMFDASRIQAGRFDFNFAPTNLSDVVKDMAGRFADQMAQAKCPFEADVKENIVGSFDPSRIEQLINNLLSNAIKYAPGKSIKMALTMSGKTAQLIVEDNGPGVPAEKRSIIFERFERATNNRYVTGLGLGLFIVREIAAGHRGSVQLEAGNGGGAKFIVSLPLI